MQLSKTNINVVLVDKEDKQIGLMEKIEAHEKGLLHRAFSVMFVRFDSQNNLEVLLQKRAKSKYHCGGLWSNTCCSHQLENEDSIKSAKRRIPEELGLNPELLKEIKLSFIGSFVYKAKLDNNLTEHEFDHVIIGETPNLDKFSSEELQSFLNKDEVSELKWMKLDKLVDDIKRNHNNYTPWLNMVVKTILNNYRN